MYTRELKEMQDGMKSKDTCKFLHGCLMYLNAEDKIPPEQLVNLLGDEFTEEEKYKIMLEIYTEIHNEIKSK